MMSRSQIDDLLEGCALLEYLGNLYEYCGSEAGKLIFQSVSDDSHIEVGYGSLSTMPEYSICY